MGGPAEHPPLPKADQAAWNSAGPASSPSREARTGLAELTVERVRGRSTITGSSWRNPLRLLMPLVQEHADAEPRCEGLEVAGGCNWVYAVSYGGGLVGGDDLSLTVDVGDGCSAVLATQASGKVYRTRYSEPQTVTRQALEATVGRGALLAILPDPVQVFSAARYAQRQRVALAAADSSVVCVDWLTAGRYSRGERWEFELYESSNEFRYQDNKEEQEGEERPPFLVDALRLAPSRALPLREAFGERENVVCSVVAVGPRARGVAEALRLAAAAVTAGGGDIVRGQRLRLTEAERAAHGELPAFRGGLRISASELQPQKGGEGGGVVARIVGQETEDVYALLGTVLRCLEPQLGGRPFSHSHQ